MYCAPGMKIQLPKIWSKENLCPINNEVIDDWKTDTVNFPVPPVKWWVDLLQSNKIDNNDLSGSQNDFCAHKLIIRSQTFTYLTNNARSAIDVSSSSLQVKKRKIRCFFISQDLLWDLLGPYRWILILRGIKESLQGSFIQENVCYPFFWLRPKCKKHSSPMFLWRSPAAGHWASIVWVKEQTSKFSIWGQAK